MTAPAMAIVPFHDHQILTCRDGETVLVVMKPIVEALGLSWQGQLERIKRHPLLGTCIRTIRTQVTGQGRDMVALPLAQFHAWLVTLNPALISDEQRREAVLLYQGESFQAIYDYWHHGRAENPRAKMDFDRQREVPRLLTQLQRETNPAVRRTLHAVLDRTLQSLDIPTPALDEIGHDAPKPPDILRPFWASVNALEEGGVPIDHAHDPGLLAVNLPDLRDAFKTAGIAFEITPTVKRALKQSPAPRFIAYKAVASRLTGGAVKCWVFERPQD